MFSFRQIYLTSYKAGRLSAFFDQKYLIQVMQCRFEKFYRNAQMADSNGRQCIQ
jgi:hypothetical protein